jgi:surfactin synthase thioesterase subunit
VEIVPLELAGRGKRSREECFTSVGEAARDLVHVLSRRSSGADYVLLGHSMGSLIAYEVACELERSGSRMPKLLVVSGRNPPHSATRWSAHTSRLPDDRLFTELSSLGGTPSGLSRSMASQLFLPSIRADLRMVDNYRTTRSTHQLRCPLLVLAGHDDPLTNSAQLQEWARYTYYACQVHHLDGTHFFVHQNVEKVAELISEIVSMNGYLADLEDYSRPERSQTSHRFTAY